jgi:phage-related protein
MASIYDTVLSWNGANTYSKYNIVLGSNSKYYYSIIDSNFNQNPITTANLQVEWDGYISLNSVLYPNFWWKPSYGAEFLNSPRVKINQFGNGYQQRIQDSINNNLKQIGLNFENRSELETVSILHFLQERNAKESFVYNLPTIYSKPNIKTMFTCPSWSVQPVSYNLYNIKVEFSEVPE